jgi:hypothetical protein
MQDAKLPSDSDNFPLDEMFNAVLKAKSTVAIFAICAMVIACLAGWFLGTYKSEGYFQFELSLPEFKRLQASIEDPARWNNFAKTRPASALAGLERTGAILGDRKQTLQLIQPIYPVTKAELKDLPDAANKDTASGISGLTIAFKAGSPELAQRGVLVLGDYLRDTAILMSYRDTLRTQYTDLLNKQKKLENSTFDTKYKLEQAEIKRTSMQAILHEYPDSAKTENRQLVSITEGGERYLSPVTQLVAIEAHIADMKQSLPRILRDQRINGLWLSYYEKMLALLDKSSSGEAFLKALPSVKDTLKLNLEDDVEMGVYNSIAIANLDAQSRYFDKVRFIANPMLPTQRSPGMPQSALIGLVLGFLLACAYVLIRHFSSKKMVIQSLNLVRAASQTHTG